ncbi:MAG: hypothetical protein ACYT04_74950 [Nostoc sp.]
MGAHVAHLTSSNLFVGNPESDRLYNFMIIARTSLRDAARTASSVTIVDIALALI